MNINWRTGYTQSHRLHVSGFCRAPGAQSTAHVYEGLDFQLDEFLKVSERDILTHAGVVSHEAAIDKARSEYEKFRKRMLEEPSPVETHFVEAVKEAKQLEKGKSKKTGKSGKKGRA